MKYVLKTILAVISMALSALYILFYFVNRFVSADDFFRSNVNKNALLVMCLFAALVAVALIAEDRAKKWRRYRRQQKRSR